MTDSYPDRLADYAANLAIARAPLNRHGPLDGLQWADRGQSGSGPGRRPWGGAGVADVEALFQPITIEILRPDGIVYPHLDRPARPSTLKGQWPS